MSKNTKKLSCKQYLKENSKRFSLVNFYEYFNFETRQSAEHALRGAVFTLNKKRKNNKKSVNELLTLLSLNNFEYLKNSAAEAFWSKVEARHSQVKRIYDQTRVQAESESALLQDIKENEPKIEKKAANKKRKYILDISEIQSQTNLKPKKLDVKLTVEDRLSLSSIMMVKDVSPLTKYKLSENTSKMIEEWQSAIKKKKETFIPSAMPTSNGEFCIYIMLSSIFINTKRESIRKSNNVKFKYTQSEIDYIIKHVSGIVQNIFSMDHILSTDWDTTSLAVKEVCQRYTAFRPDCLIITYNGVEVGTIEIKPLDTCKELVDIDACRVAEICKRQLHLRMKVAKTTKEFATFGIIIAGKRIFFNSLRLDTVDGTYKYFQHGEVSLPSFESTTTDMKVFLESMLSFKERIKESLASEEEEKLPPLFDEYSHFIKPTIALKDDKEKSAI
ncbi:hypothetical protein RMCBS344292_14071 [Rhizopus microsporus]|nr:hypothetical protein RMCBS344292_14071 [Rhizopus microsporus]